MSDVAIRAEHLSKCYRIGPREPYKTLQEVIINTFYTPLRRLRGQELKREQSPSQSDVIWAIQDVSFEIQRGEAVGVIGSNGAGKSTLLKILSRITEPSEGVANIYGKVGSLLEVGTGFHPELTGRENIFLNGAILGMKRHEIKKKFDEIVQFAEVEKFIDTPVKHYSSGMHVRLAFAIAAHLEPEILLVDEVLAVGDAAFQQKCVGKMGDVTKEGRTVLFVSHNMFAVMSLCNRAVLIDQGRILLDGDPNDVVSTYISSTLSKASSGEIEWSHNDQSPGGKEVKLRAIRLIAQDKEVKSIFDTDEEIKVEITYEVKGLLRGLRLRLSVLTFYGEIAFQTLDHTFRDKEVDPGLYKSICTIPTNLLNVGKYFLRVRADISGKKIVIPSREYLSFQITGDIKQNTKNWSIERIEVEGQ